MAVSKVVKSNGDVIMDISQDNVNPNNLLQGGTAHGSDGEAVQGAVNLNNYVQKSGDTMTGNLSMKTTRIDRTVNPSSYKVGESQLVYRDTNGKAIGAFFPFRSVNGDEWVSFYAYNETTSGTQVNNAFEMGVTRDGTAKYQVSSPSAFCNAIGALQTTGGTMTGDLTFAQLKGLRNSNFSGEILLGDNVIYTTVYDLNGFATVELDKTNYSVKLRNQVGDELTGTENYIEVDNLGISFKSDSLEWTSSNIPTGTGTNLVIDGSGYIKKSSSTRSVKHNINYIDNINSYHEALMRLKPATFIYNSDETETLKLGMIAEDVADVCPIAGMVDKNGKVENYDDRAIIAMLVAEVQRLNAEIEKLKGR